MYTIQEKERSFLIYSKYTSLSTEVKTKNIKTIIEFWDNNGFGYQT